MSATGRPAGKGRLEQIEEGLVESVLDASEESLRQELAAVGSDPVAVIAEIDSAIASATARASRARLEQAKADVKAWQNTKVDVSSLNKEKARSRLTGLRSRAGNPQGEFMLAARKGKGLSKSDEDGLIEDMAELERLEGGDDEG